MELTAEQIVQNWEKLLQVIEQYFTGDRKTNLMRLYTQFEDRMSVCPASGKDYYHGAFPGGYIQHVLNVVNFAEKLDQLWIDGGAVRDYDFESLIFTALNHDLGKIGDMDEEYYVQHNEKWRKERGEMYIINDKLRHMAVPDRSLWLLQQFNITFTQSEMIAIKLHDGMYDEGNKSYLVAYSENKQLRDYLPIVLHHADMMATFIEKNQWSQGKIQSNDTTKKNVNFSKKIKTKEMSDLTKQFFNLE